MNRGGKLEIGKSGDLAIGKAACNCVCDHQITKSPDVYGPTPPLWQSAQLTWVTSPMSTGCLNWMPAALPITGCPLITSAMTVWQTSHCLETVLPSVLAWPPSWQRKQPAD